MARSFARTWLLPHHLGLDAPVLALAWLHVFARNWRVDYHPWQAYAALALVVWAVRVFVRLLDDSMAGPVNQAARHAGTAGLMLRHRGWFKGLAWLAVIAAALLVGAELPVDILRYLVFAGILLAGFLAATLFPPRGAEEVPYTRNVLAGLAMAYGTAMLAHVYQSSSGPIEMPMSREFLCFSLLCILGMFAIDLWEHSAAARDDESRVADELSLALPLLLLGGGALFFAWQDTSTTSRPFFYAILTAAALLHVLNRTRARFEAALMPALAGLVLLLPVLVFLVLRSD